MGDSNPAAGTENGATSFVSGFHDDLLKSPDKIIEYIDNAIADESAEELSYSLTLGSFFGLPTSAALTLAPLLSKNGHRSHEDIVDFLQEFRDPRTVYAVFQVSETILPYLAWDDNFAFNRKCTWALYKIGTEEAFEKLDLLAKSDNPKIRAFAAERLVAAGRAGHDMEP